MPAYSFQPRFVALIESGEKRHTIRPTRKQKQRIGAPCYLFTGMRTKACRRLFTAPCVRVEGISISATQNELTIVVDGVPLSADEADHLAKKDGFQNAREMRLFWHLTYGQKLFTGEIIHWDYERRVMPQEVSCG